MKNATTTTSTLGSRLFSAFVWELSLLGHKTLDLVRELLKPGGWFRGLPHVRILLVLSMLVLIFDEDVAFTLRLGEADIATSAEKNQTTSTNAGFFSTSASLFGEVFSSSAFAKTDLTLMDSKTGSALIDRFEATALAEQEKLGVDAGVLIATAIAAGVVETPSQVADTKFTTNFFGHALNGSYPSAWSSWRAMSLAILATTESADPHRDDFVRAAAQQFPDAGLAQQRIYEALRFYQL